MPNPLLPFEQAVTNLEQPLLDAKAAHEAAQEQFRVDIQEAVLLRDAECAAPIGRYVSAKQTARAKTQAPADAYAAKRAEFDAAIRARNEAIKELRGRVEEDGDG